METIRALELRHSVRSFMNKPFLGDLLATLDSLVADANKDGGLHIQVVLGQPKAFDNFLAHYGNFQNVNNYFALIAKKGKDEAIGYYGEKLVLELQKLGLNTCWVGGTFSKDKKAYDIGRSEKLYAVIAFGYSEVNGHPHKSKDFSTLVDGKQEDLPDWFIAGAEAARLAPTALNQQKFKLSLGKDDKVQLKMGRGAMVNIDKGILKYNFEVGAASKGHTVEWK